MKKKTIFMVALSTLFSVGAMSYLSSFKDSQHVHIHEEHEEKKMDVDESNYSKEKLSTFSNGKETKYFNITTGNFIQTVDKRFQFSVVGDIPTSWKAADEFKYYYNNKEMSNGASFTTGSDNFYFNYGDNVPAAEQSNEYRNTNYYTHYQIKAGTIIFSDSTTNYVLENDYNWWSTVNNGNLGAAYICQHGGNLYYAGSPKQSNGDVNSLKFVDDNAESESKLNGAIQDGFHRFLGIPNYKRTNDFTYSNFESTRCPIYIDKHDGNGYVLSSSADVSPIILNGYIDSTGGGTNLNQGETPLYMIMQYGQLFGSENADKNFDKDPTNPTAQINLDKSYYSYYIPKGTLWGGLNTPFMIEEDYYFEITNEAVNGSYIHGFYKTAHDYEKHDAKEPTCTDTGNVEYYTCRDTHKGDHEYSILKEGEYVKATLEEITIQPNSNNHSYSYIEKVDATATTHGTKDHYKCDYCSKLFEKNENEEYVEVTEEYLTIHNLVELAAKKATCTQYGNKECFVCSCPTCDKIYTKDSSGNLVEADWSDVLIEAAHSYGTEIAEVAATESKHGTKAHYKCSVCSKLFVKDGSIYVEATEESLVLHNLLEVEAKNATCTEDGNKAYSKCTCEGCGKLFTKDESGNLVETTLDKMTEKASGHQYGEWKFDETNLKITHTCQNCNQSETVDVNEENGFTYKVVSEPTTTSEGKATWTSSKYGTFTVTLPKLESKGCGGEIVTTSAILASLSLITISFGFAALSKKKKEE